MCFFYIHYICKFKLDKLVLAKNYMFFFIGLEFKFVGQLVKSFKTISQLNSNNISTK